MAIFDKFHHASTEETAEHAALYCLGDFPEEDRKSYEEHLSVCSVCRSEVRKYCDVIAELARSEPGNPSAEARTEFLNQIHQELGKRQRWDKIRSVIITPQLSDRPARGKNRERASAALDDLSKSRAGMQQEVLDAAVRAARELCDAGTAGFSVLYEEEQVFRWDALAGELAAAKGGTTPRTWSPCGTTLDMGTPQLFSHPARCFEYFRDSPREIVEGLVVPVYVGGKPLGTLWVASHNEHKFDKEDVQALQQIADSCAKALGSVRAGQVEGP